MPEVLLRSDQAGQTELALASEGVLRYVWQTRWGDMLIEVIGNEAWVNGRRVEPMAADQASALQADPRTWLRRL